MADVGQPVARRGLERVRDDAEPVRGRDAVHAGARLDRECINGWRGLSPLALNPGTRPARFRATAGATTRPSTARSVDALGRPGEHLRHGRDGLRRSPWDNVGVQYGLEALRAGSIREQFLDLNANVGSWKASKDMVQEGCPYIPAACANPANIDVWSARNMLLSPDGGATPAARREGNREAGYRLPLERWSSGQARHPGDRLASLPRAPARRTTRTSRSPRSGCSTTTATRRTS